MNTIHSTKIGNRTFFKASDVFEAIGSRWHGYEQLKGIPTTHYKMVTGSFPTKKGALTTGKFIGLTEKGVAAVCKAKKAINPLTTPVKPTKVADSAQLNTNRDVERLQQEVAGLKALFACSLTVNKALLTPKKDDSTLAGLTARELIREHVSNFARSKATELAIVDKDDFGMVYNLSFNKLYNYFHKLHGVDLKAEADKAGVTGLQYAEDEGYIDLLLIVTEKLFA